MRNRRIVRSAMVEVVLGMPATVAVPTPVNRPGATRASFRPSIYSNRKPRAIEGISANPGLRKVTSRAAMSLPGFSPTTPEPWPGAARDF